MPKAVSPAVPASRHLPLVVLLFVGSGAAALVYEVIWFQLLQLVIGATAISLGVLLATFMGGMCIGSLAAPRLIARGAHPLKVYAALEVGIAVAGLVVLFAVPGAGRAYAALGAPGVGMRAVLAGLVLLPPTFLMGATLPVIARWVETTPRGMSWLGFFYGGNIAGAVLGCLAAGFYLLRVHDVTVATLVAMGLNLAVALVAWALAARVPVAADAAKAGAVDDSPLSLPSRLVLVAIALSGLAALGAEVVWTRMLTLLLGGTVYSFALILAVFLTGLGLGSSASSAAARRLQRPALWLAGCQLLQVVAILWAARQLSVVLPYLKPSPEAWPWSTLLGLGATSGLAIDLVKCASALLPAAFLWGASFPLALAALAAPGRDPGRLAGVTYAANTVGAILGALGAALVAVPGLGMQGTQELLIGISALAAVLAGASGATAPGRLLRPALALGLLVAIAGAAWSIRRMPAVPWQLIAFGRQLPVAQIEGTMPLYVGEGLNSTVAVTDSRLGIRSFHVAGKTEASTSAKDMRLQHMLAHIPALLHPQPRTVLIVGCGSGVTAGTFLQFPSVERVVICEIEPLIPQRVAPFFKEQNHDVVKDPRVQIVHDDARHFILTTKEKFDIITSDPIHPWVKGAATLYTSEYFDLVKERLNPGGLVTQWVPLYQTSKAVLQSEFATFLGAFPEGSIWGNAQQARIAVGGQRAHLFPGGTLWGHPGEEAGFDVVMLGQVGPLRIDVDEVQRRLERPDYAEVRRSLDGMGFGSAVNLLGNYAGHRRDLSSWLADGVINRDRNLRLQYLAGLQANSTEGSEAYRPLLANRLFPEDLIVGRPETLAAVRIAMNLPRPPEPVIPARPLFSVPLAYPSAQAAAGTEGFAELSYVVDTRGQARSVALESASDPAFGEAAWAALESTPFTPALSGDRPVTSGRQRLRVDFARTMIDAGLLDEIRDASTVVEPRQVDGGLKPWGILNPMFPERLLRAGVTSGNARIEFIIDRRGYVRLPRIVSATREEFGWAAATVLLRYRFAPPTSGGRPVNVRVTLPIAFQAPPGG